MSMIFVSYKRENLAPVQRMVQSLRGAGLDVWWDQDIAPNDPWEATIERQLEAAKVVIVAWSPAAVASENVKAEARRARQQGKLLQTFVEPCEPPLFFGERQGVDLSTWNGAANDGRLETVIAAARALLAGKKPPQGVGYAPKRRKVWAALTAVFLFIGAVLGFVSNVRGAREAVCSLAALGTFCPAPIPEPPIVTQERLLQSMSGVWTNDEDEKKGAPHCENTMTLAMTRGEDGVHRLRMTADPDFDKTAQVIAVDTQGRIVTLQSADGSEEFRYRVDGDTMVVTEPPRGDRTRPRVTPLRRCG